MIPVDLYPVAMAEPAIVVSSPAPTLTLDALASRIAGKPVHVLCPTLAAYAVDPNVASTTAERGGFIPSGFAEPWNGTVTLPDFECAEVVSEIVADPSGAGEPNGLGYLEDVRGVFALFHETSHVAVYPDPVYRDEHATDCRALKVMPSVLASLGVPAARAQWFESVAAAIHAATPEPYAGACS